LNEELFSSNMMEKIPFYGALVRGSERNMVVGLNLLRLSVFKEMAQRPGISTEALGAWADYINVATGQGNVEVFGKTLKILNATVFSPKFVISRVQTPYYMAKAAWSHKELRGPIAKDMIGTVSSGMLALGLAAMAGAKVQMDDPESSDWGKIVIGNTRIDIFAGFQQPARVVAFIMKSALAGVGLTKMNTRKDILDTATGFAQYKISPLMTIPLELIEKKNIVGQEVTPPETLIRAVTPLVAQEIYDTMKMEKDPVKVGAYGTLAILGSGVSTYKKRKKKRKDIR